MIVAVPQESVPLCCLLYVHTTMQTRQATAMLRELVVKGGVHDLG